MEDTKIFVEELQTTKKIVPAPAGSVRMTPLFVARKTQLVAEYDTAGRLKLRVKDDEHAKQRLVTDMKRSGANACFLHLPFCYGDFARHLAQAASERH